VIYRIKQIFFSTLAITAGLCISLSIHHLVSYVCANISGFDPEIGLKGLIGLPVHYNYWTFERVFLVQVFPSLFCFALAFLFLNVKRHALKEFPLLKLFLFWCALALITMLPSNVILSFFGYEKYNSDLYRGFAMLNSWLYLDRFAVIVMGILSLFLQYYMGGIFLKDFLVFIGKQEKADDVLERARFLLFMFVIPFVLGVGVYIFLTYPKEVEYGLLRAGLLALSMLVIVLVSIGPTNQILVEEVDISKSKGFLFMLPLLFAFYLFWELFLK
jgi:hypothetical protein